MKYDTIDILLATYNGFSFIASQLDSILAQSYKDIHLIIRDDLSTDCTRKILETYANRFPDSITLVASEKRLGVKGNFSALMEHSSASYVMFADQDDIWECNKVSKTYVKMKELEANVSVDAPLLVHTDLKVVDRDLNVLSQSFWQYSEIDPFKGQAFSRLLMQNVVTGCTVMMNRPLLLQAFPIPESSVMHDWWIALVAAAFGKIDIVIDTTLLYRQHGSNTLGAQKFFSFNHFKQGMSKIWHPEIDKQAQVNELLNRFSESLDSDKMQMLEAFKKLPQANFLEKTFLIFKYKFYKNGFLRNLVNIVIKKQ